MRRSSSLSASRTTIVVGAVLLAVLVIASTAVLTSAARAQVDGDPLGETDDPATDLAQDPGPGCSDATELEQCDTNYTPIAKDGQELGWTQVAGDVHPDGNPIGYKPEDSAIPNPTTIDFYSVDFANEYNGLAAGAACENPSTAEEDLATCTRVPVIYRYGFDERGLPQWKEVFRGEEPGFVGAVTWLTRDTALAVGGTGTYPRREPVCKPPEENPFPPQEDRCQSGDDYLAYDRAHGAGEGRAWYSPDIRASAIFKPVPLPDPPADGASALTAADSTFGMSPARAALECDASTECAFAGGLRQIWMWRDGGFVPGAFDPADDTSKSDNGSTPQYEGDPVEGSANWRYRVRAVRFQPEPRSGANAVTSGCCAGPDATGQPDQSRHRPAVITWRSESQSWMARLPSGLTGSGNPDRNLVLPESIYSIVYPSAGGTATESYLHTTGGPERAAEPPSYVSKADSPTGGSQSAVQVVLDGQAWSIGGFFGGPTVSAARLVAADGDVEGHHPNTLDREGIDDRYQGTRFHPDGLADWAIGELRTSRQAIAYTTARRAYGLDAPYPLDCPEGGISGAVESGRPPTDCQPDVEGGSESLKSGTLFSLPSYRLNSISAIGQTGISWAAGDRGALVRLAGSGLSGTLPPEQRPALGAKKRAPAPDREPYATGTSLTGTPGIVPPLATRPTQRATSPELVPFGSIDPAPTGEEQVAAMTFSRDGTEGWAVGPYTQLEGRGTMTLAHFDGTKWTKCRFHPIPGVIEADPACTALTDLREFERYGVWFTAIARVPLEYDADPTNDGEFEAIAIATPAKEITGVDNNTLVRYRNGKWELDSEGTESLALASHTDPANPIASTDGSKYKITDIAFSAPDDGWIVGALGGGLRIFHFDGTKWIACTTAENKTTQPSTSQAAKFPEQVNRSKCQDPGPDRSPEIGGDQGVFPAHDWSSGGERLRVTSAGDRIYLYGTRGAGTKAENGGAKGPRHPVILYNDPGACEKDGDDGCWKQAFDPKYGVGAGPDDSAGRGTLRSLSVARGADGYTGWGIGEFGIGSFQESVDELPSQEGRYNAALQLPSKATATLRSAADGTTWEPEPVDGPARDYLLRPPLTKDLSRRYREPQIVALPDSAGRGGAVATRSTTGAGSQRGPIVWFDPVRERWETFSTPWNPYPSSGQGWAKVMEPDNRGGVWLAVQDYGADPSWLYRATLEVPKPVLGDAPHPVREPITAAAGGSDGSFWVATAGNAVYRYDRITGWDRMTVPGWDPGRVVTRASRANAIAVGPGGEGLVVGEGGRIAQIDAQGTILDAAAGTLCSRERNRAPCGTGRDLHAAAVAPDGSALVGGKYLSLLYRPAGESFRAISPPPSPAAAFAAITGLSMPTPDRAWLTTDTGYIFRGDRDGGGWSWTLEASDEFGDTIARNESNINQSLRAVAVNASGDGFAVGDDGVVLERAEGKWKMLPAGYYDDLVSVTNSPDGRGALVGGENGLVLTLDAGRLKPARHADYYDPLTYSGAGNSSGSVVGVALVPGHATGQVEAWAASRVSASLSRNPPPSAILHYGSDPHDPLLDGGIDPSAPLSDAPESRPGEVSFASFGRSECQVGECPELTGSNKANDVLAHGVRDQLLADSPDFALFTGDVGEVAGGADEEALSVGTHLSQLHARWAEQITRPLSDEGIPSFAAIGENDLSEPELCANPTVCHAVTEVVDTAGLKHTNLPWRQTMSTMPEPWGSGDEATSASDLEFAPISSSQPEVEPGDQSTPDPTGDGELKIPTGGARTHYAFDVERDGEAILRVAVVDTSLRSLSASDAVQNPVQEQLGWLRDVLASTPEGVRKVVVSNTPTYSYGPGAGTDTQTDGTVFESVLMAEDVDLVVSGRMGWNGLYWALAPGLHYPCPGSAYPGSKPAAVSACGTSASQVDELAEGLQEQGGTVLGEGTGDAIPFVVASSAGGKFGPEGHDDGSAAEGYWRGYTLVRMEPGPNGRIVVEQRPVYDWVGLTGSKHVMRPRSKLTLNGFGREPAGIDVPLRYFQIDSPAVTHRYDLLRAKASEPWLPLTDSEAAAEADGPDACGEYVCLSEDVGSVHSQTGVVQAGAGRHSGAYAVAMLSIGDDVATKPLYFETSPSFRAAASPTPKPVPKGAATPPAPKVETPHIPEFNSPTFDAPPVPPPLALVPPAALAPSEASPPSPPVPPPAVPANPAPSPLDLSFAPTGLTVAPAASVIPPPAPPINPAPPGGARKEARQRQAASQSSGADGAEGSGEAQELGGDLAQNADRPEGAEMTRRDPGSARQEHSFTRLNPASEASPILTWGAGLTIAALTLALAFTTLRPRSRRREPELPAPAWSAARRQRR